jgi:hypothetical protein
MIILFAGSPELTGEIVTLLCSLKQLLLKIHKALKMFRERKEKPDDAIIFCAEFKKLNIYNVLFSPKNWGENIFLVYYLNIFQCNI